jgi:hypothetical protein
MEDKLKFIFANVNDWLKFIETKNAAIIAFNSAALFYIIDFLIDKTDYRMILYIILFTFSLSIIVSILSFIPNLVINKSKLNPSDNDNLLYFGSICKYNAESYLTCLYAKYDEEVKSNFSHFELNLVNQIIINSKITMQKCDLFNWSIKLIFFGLIISTITFIIIA